MRRWYVHFLRLGLGIDQILTLIDNVDIWHDELYQFERTLENWKKRLEKMMKQTQGDIIAGDDVFLLSDTYGFPLELTQELAAEHGYEIDHAGYDDALRTSRERAQSDAQSTFSRWIDWARHLEGVNPTIFVGYETMSVEDPQIIKQISLDDGRLVMIFDKTPFYAESGGQTGDKGTITLDDGTTKQIVDVKQYNGVFLHFVAS